MDKPKKYELIQSNKKTLSGKNLFQIKALIDFSIFKKGELGGYVESEKNLDQSGNAWVSGDAMVYGDAWVYGNAWVSGDARVSGNAWVYGDARVYGDAWVYGDARVYGNARVSFRLCSRFSFSKKEELDLWLKKEKEFEEEVKKISKGDQ